MRSRFATIALLLAALPVGAQIRPDKLVYPPVRFTPAKPQVLRLANGIPVYLIEDHEVPLVRGFAVVRGGSLWEPQAKAGLASLTGEVMRTGGAGAKSGDELDTRLEFLAAQIETGFGDEYGSASFSCLTENLQEVLGYFNDVLSSPRFENRKIEVARTQMLDDARRRWDYPDSIASAVFAELLYGKGSPYSTYSTTASIRALTRQDLMDFHASYWVPANITLAISGHFRTNELMAVLERTLGVWKAAPAPRTTPPPVLAEPKPGIYFVNKKGTQQASIMLGHLGPARNSPDHYTLAPMNYILGTGDFNSRLMRELRSNRGLTYGVDGGVFEGVVRGSLDVSLQTGNESAAEAVQAVREVLDAFGKGTIAAEERKIAFNYLENSFVFRSESAGAILQQTIIRKLQGYPEDYQTTYLDRVRRVTDAQMLDAARRNIHPDRLVVLIVGDREGLADQLKKLGDVTEVPFPES